jgi:hypothetical protein
LPRRQKSLLKSSAHGLRANIPEASGAVQRSQIVRFLPKIDARATFTVA